MIAKKNPRYDLERKRTALFQVGLLTVGSFTLAAFAWQSPLVSTEKKVRKGGEATSFVYELEVKPQEKTPDKTMLLRQKESDNSSSVDTKQEVSEEMKYIANDDSKNLKTTVAVNHTINFKETIHIKQDMIEIEGDDIVIPDIDPSFLGGSAAMQKFMKNELKYPQEAVQLGIEGNVYLEFVVEKDGSVTNVRVVQGADDVLNREAVRLAKKMPKWMPGETAGRKVRSHMRLPIVFRLN
jgi:protein TonB